MSAGFERLRERAVQHWAELEARPWVRVGTGLLGGAAGAGETLRAIRAEVDRAGIGATVSEVGSMGLCFAEPLVDIAMPSGPRVLYARVGPDEAADLVRRHLEDGEPWVERALASVDSDVVGLPRLEELPMMRLQQRVALRNAGHVEPTELLQYMARGGYEGLDRALAAGRDAVLQTVKDSGLRGRGGAAFPTGVKWGFLSGSTAARKYILCNGEEGDPGAFNDKAILESDPFSLVEGCTIAGYATGATNGIIFIRHGHDEPIDRARAAIDAAYAAGLLGGDIAGSGFSFDMELSLVGDSYVAGEETALMEAVEGKRAMPRFRPPFPAAVGVWGQPSNINNIKTLAYVPEIVRRGAGWFRSLGTESSPGTAIACLSGHVRYPGLVEVPFGITMRQLVEEVGGGTPHGGAVKLVQTGGPLGGLMAGADLDLVLDFDAMARAGALFGSGGLIVADDSASAVGLTRTLVAFDQMESCGKCFPCRLGMSHLLEVLERICAGASRPDDLALMERIGTGMRAGSLCGHGQLGFNPVASALRAFGEEFAAQAAGRGPVPVGPFVGPSFARRGAQLAGETPSSSVRDDFVARVEPVGTPWVSAGRTA